MRVRHRGPVAQGFRGLSRRIRPRHAASHPSPCEEITESNPSELVHGTHSLHLRGSQDDAFVRELQRALGDQGVSVWIDSRDLLLGGQLAPDIKGAINGAAAFAVLVSPSALQSTWVDKEVRHAIKVQKEAWP